MWSSPESKLKVISAVIGTLDSVPAKLKKILDQLKIEYVLRAVKSHSGGYSTHIKKSI